MRIKKLNVQNTEQERILKAVRRKDQVPYKTRSTRTIPDFLKET